MFLWHFSSIIGYLLLHWHWSDSTFVHSSKIYFLVLVHSFWEHSCAILGSFKIMIIFNNTSAYFVLISVCSFLEHSCSILSSFKIMIIFNNTSADFFYILADVLLKLIIILKELRIAQLIINHAWILTLHFWTLFISLYSC
jgi:hypothetical protein